MRSNLNYKTKNRVLFLSILLILIFLWKYHFNSTYSIYQHTRSLSNNLIESSLAPSTIKHLQSQASQTGIIFSRPEVLEPQMTLVEAVNKYITVNNVSVRKVFEPRLDTLGNFILETNRLIAAGGFRQLNGLVYTIEQGERLGMVSSCDFKIISDHRTRSTELTADIFIQNIWRK